MQVTCIGFDLLNMLFKNKIEQDGTKWIYMVAFSLADDRLLNLNKLKTGGGRGWRAGLCKLMCAYISKPKLHNCSAAWRVKGVCHSTTFVYIDIYIDRDNALKVISPKRKQQVLTFHDTHNQYFLVPLYVYVYSK